MAAVKKRQREVFIFISRKIVPGRNQSWSAIYHMVTSAANHDAAVYDSPMPWIRRVVGAFVFIALVLLWNREALAVRASATRVALMFMSLVPVPLAALLGRVLLRRRHSSGQLASITLGVHYAVMLAMGIAIINAFKLAEAAHPWPFSFPRAAATALVYVTGAAVGVTVLNLALSGLGAPFALALSRRLATGWLYRHTRNPMVLSLILFFVALGLWLRSGLFLLWLAAGLVPAEIAVLKLFEEYELKLRFGSSYVAYKETTPMLLGRRR